MSYGIYFVDMDVAKVGNLTDIQKAMLYCMYTRNTGINKSYSRMMSYWNEFYRGKEPNFHKYICKKLFREYLGYGRTFENKCEFERQV